MAAAAPAIIGGIADLLGGIFGSNAANDAASVLAGTEGQNSNQEIGVGQQMMQQQLGRLTPYWKGGTQAFQTLSNLLKPGGGLIAPTFQAPTAVTMQNDPGYQFRLNQGMNQLQNSAAARGDLLSGNTLQALDQFNQDYASNEYGNVYNRALQNYGANLAGTNATFSRLMGAGGMGLNAASGMNAANSLYDEIYGNAMNMSNQAGAAKAAGIMGSNNAWMNALGGIGGTAMSLPWGNLSSIFGGSTTPGILNASAIPEAPNFGGFTGYVPGGGASGYAPISDIMSTYQPMMPNYTG